jgi:hypothetical protein
VVQGGVIDSRAIGDLTSSEALEAPFGDELSSGVDEPLTAIDWWLDVAGISMLCLAAL